MIKSYFVDGDKGGVGKSFVSRCLVDSFINHEVSGMPKIDKLIVIDADPMNPDVVCDNGYKNEAINGIHIIGLQRPIKSEDDWLNLINELAECRIDTIWLATAPMDMRAGTDTALARVVSVFGAAHPHTADLFANRRANRIKVLVHDGIGVWLAARRLHQGKFVWPSDSAAQQWSLNRTQLDALVLGLPWQRMGEAGIIRVV